MNYLLRSVFALALLAAPLAHAAETMPPSLAALAAQTAPAVVSITALSPTGQAVAAADDGGAAGGDSGAVGAAPADMQKAEGLVIPPPRTTEALGSGFIFEPSGYILTNNHVVQGATDVSVTLVDGTVYPAVIVGLDPDADLAVLKINAGHALPFLTFGNAAAVKVGDWVLAVGNPYGMANTNTFGIVSALHRQIDDTKFDDFIQTDAAINRGNSGGPLLNMQGQVVGVNAAIYAPAGTSDGIGFSIPSSMAGPVADALVRNGKMIRGWLGVSIEEISPQIETALRLPSANGALVGAVASNGPAAGKLQPGDVITAVGGVDISNPRALMIRTAEIQAGQTVQVSYIRNGAAAEKDLTITVPPSAQANKVTADQADYAEPLLLSALGLGLSDNQGANGAIVTMATGAAASAGIMVGDFITQVNGIAVSNARQLVEAARKLEHNPVVLFVTTPTKGDDQSQSRWVVVKPQEPSIKPKS